MAGGKFNRRNRTAICNLRVTTSACRLGCRATSGTTSPTRDTRREASRRASPNGALRTLQLARRREERVAKTVVVHPGRLRANGAGGQSPRARSRAPTMESSASPPAFAQAPRRSATTTSLGVIPSTPFLGEGGTRPSSRRRSATPDALTDPSHGKRRPRRLPSKRGDLMSEAQ